MKRLVTIAIIATCLSPIIVYYATPALGLPADGSNYCIASANVRFYGWMRISQQTWRILNFVWVSALIVPVVLWAATVFCFCYEGTNICEHLLRLVVNAALKNE
jgi:hypothetical protein